MSNSILEGRLGIHTLYRSSLNLEMLSFESLSIDSLSEGGKTLFFNFFTRVYFLVDGEICFDFSKDEGMDLFAFRVFFFINFLEIERGDLGEIVGTKDCVFISLIFEEFLSFGPIIELIYIVLSIVAVVNVYLIRIRDSNCLNR